MSERSDVQVFQPPPRDTRDGFAQPGQGADAAYLQGCDALGIEVLQIGRMRESGAGMQPRDGYEIVAAMFPTGSTGLPSP